MELPQEQAPSIAPWKAFCVAFLLTLPLLATGLFLSFYEGPQSTHTRLNLGVALATSLLVVGNGYLSAGHALGLGYRNKDQWIGFLAIAIWTALLLYLNPWALAGSALIALGFLHGRWQRTRIQRGELSSALMTVLWSSLWVYLALPALLSPLAIFLN